ncbi:MAG TPA: helix-turn-helix transcriptional regulator [Thermoleophilaceae bacterium]
MPIRHDAEMAARGDTNKEIAQALVITPKTVENHLGRVYMKLDVHSRGALGASLGADALAAP